MILLQVNETKGKGGEREGCGFALESSKGDSALRKEPKTLGSVAPSYNTSVSLVPISGPMFKWFPFHDLLSSPIATG